MPLLVWLFALTLNSVSPLTINSVDEIITASVSASGITNTMQYLQAALTKAGEARYFGYTQNLGGEWYQYAYKTKLSDEDKGVFYGFTPVSSTWSGQVKIKVDVESPSYKGPDDYALKLFRYVTSGGIESENTLSIRINIPLASSVSAETQTVQTQQAAVALPFIDVKIPTSCILGEDFKVSANIKNFEKETEYYLKLRGGIEENTLTKVQTKNGNGYFSDKADRNSLPLIKTDSNGFWSGDVWGLVDEDKEEGTYKARLKVWNKETGTFSESEFREIAFSKPEIIVAPVATKSSVIATSPAQIKTKEPEVLGAATEIATPAPVKTQIIPKKDFSPLAILGGGLVFVAIIMAAFLHKDRLWDIIKRCKISWPHFS